MESLYLLIPLSAALVLAIIAVFGWALHKGQFEDLEAEGARILQEDIASVDADQFMSEPSREQSRVLEKPRL
ncbi:MAG: cbb3-type cytochrome oxidase assembly protein CcoS [Aquabacterium sp.]|uniref:cbb3-type cytochrome oxidase assembly protein CcoS n=1 Tax=Aquabacterium sp. TaxID=1872578 RepID=UPI00271F1197|nr:cbb3-type cytochrome oxidase assembly protein CcoS [Aquabacterium sp.]MDO9002546.1 cbb3-type cytochrome oxidase assembly protein CcoS [Aquabacterium sp.]